MAFWERVMAGWRAYRDYGRGTIRDKSALDERYALLGAFYSGAWANDSRWKLLPTDIYRNARQVVKHTGAIVDCYQQLVYTGDLPTPTRTLPAGVMSAIPIEAQTGNETDDEALLRAFYTGFDIWKMRQLMSLIPKTAAIFGDVLVMIAEDYERGEFRGTTTLDIIGPWNVPPNGLELDGAGNIKAVAIEYDVNIEASTAFGRQVPEQHFRYRKELTPTEIRYYKDDKPWTDLTEDGHGEAVQGNPYDFVPGAWFRHELVVGSDRGMGAFERTLLQSLETTSLLSSAIDHSRKIFGSPIGVTGSALRPGKRYTLPGGLTITASTTAADIDQARREDAESQNFLPLTEGGGFVTIPYDIGQTRELLEFIDNNLIEENPEAKYAQLLAELRTATGPGVSAVLAPIRAKVQAAANNHDLQMVKLCQMNTSIMGFRVNNGDIPANILSSRKDRYDAYRPFTLESYGQGKEDASIPVRDPFPESKLEKAQWVTLVDGMSDWGKREMGIPEEEIAKMAAARNAQLDREAELLAGLQSDQQQGGGQAA